MDNDVIYYNIDDKNAGEREGYYLELVARAGILVVCCCGDKHP